MNILIIVDAQNDFIEGGKLPVTGGTKALDNVANLIENGDIDQVFTTQDWHPAFHCSFSWMGGTFPEHCVMDSYGAKIYQPIIDAILKTNVEILGESKKGRSSIEDQFSAFTENCELYKSSAVVETVEHDEYTFGKTDHLIICGLAGDICVLNTLKALNIEGAPYQLSVYLDGIASLDDGTKLREYMLQNNIKAYKG